MSELKDLLGVEPAECLELIRNFALISGYRGEQ